MTQAVLIPQSKNLLRVLRPQLGVFLDANFCDENDAQVM
jgi:hypothetical protein